MNMRIAGKKAAILMFDVRVQNAGCGVPNSESRLSFFTCNRFVATPTTVLLQLALFPGFLPDDDGIEHTGWRTEGSGGNHI
jgi:hypothetical protein